MIVLMTQLFGEIKACLCVRMDAHLLPTYPEVVVILLFRFNIMRFKKNSVPLYLDFPFWWRVCLFVGVSVLTLIIWWADFGWLTCYLNRLLISLEAQQRLSPLFAVLSFSQRRWKNEKVFPACNSRLFLPTALYRSLLSCWRQIPAAVVSVPAPPLRQIHVSVGIFNVNFGAISVCVNALGFCGRLLFRFYERMFMNAQKCSCKIRPGGDAVSQCIHTLIRELCWFVQTAQQELHSPFELFLLNCRLYTCLWSKCFYARLMSCIFAF